jgi:hypothetical protein
LVGRQRQPRRLRVIVGNGSTYRNIRKVSTSHEEPQIPSLIPPPIEEGTKDVVQPILRNDLAATDDLPTVQTECERSRRASLRSQEIPDTSKRPVPKPSIGTAQLLKRAARLQ